MAITVFRVINLDPTFRYQAGSGFWFRANSDGSLLIDDQGTVDPADDVIIGDRPAGQSADTEGTFIWLSKEGLTSTVGDILNTGTPLEKFENPQDFVVDGDAADPRSTAAVLLGALAGETFQWLPNNPEYNTVAPLLKDGLTPNPDFDNTGNPFLADGVTRASRTNDQCLKYIIETLVV